MELGAFFDSEFDEQAAVAVATKAALKEPFERLVAIAVSCIRNGGKILFFGNGGSAADCQHLATELTIRYISDRAPIAAIALTTDSSALTAGGNDIGFENIFARQVAALAKPGDLAIGISTSGNSENVIRALKQAKDMGVTAAAFGGKGGGPMADVADPYLVVPAKTTSRIQEMHITLGHMLCGALETELELV
ncbi:MAG: SIS domain-containing protein [Rhodospirillaceae bacterium]|jgi:D-sedoheptulose 7-phosphate isomerase|nr:SIS domain-containing protein [Rhodospirillaceae bacterium]